MKEGRYNMDSKLIGNEKDIIFYTDESELKKLNNLTNLFFNYAETMAKDNQVMTMKDWMNETDSLKKRFLTINGFFDIIKGGKVVLWKKYIMEV